MEDKKSKKPDSKFPMPKGPKFNYYWLYGLVAVFLIALPIMSQLNTGLEETNQSYFEQEMLKTHDVEKIEVVNKSRVEVFLKEEALENKKYEKVKDNKPMFNPDHPHYYFTIGSAEEFKKDMDRLQQDFTSDEIVPITWRDQKSFLDSYGWILTIFLFVAIWIFIMRRVSGGAGGAGGQIFNIGKSKALLFDGDGKVTVSFKDVAGLDEAKEEVMEVVDFLKNPKKYTSLGGKIPKGVLLVGPPGTGKTLMAKAVAGEAQVPFFSISGSDFVEMFVGVGASRVRDLFKQAREKAPCIIFIDEIDAIGRARGKNMVQGNDERENTLNQLLVEMDGFASDAGVIIVAATNRPDVLDSALLRPGRFDRQISIDRPDLVGREQIFKVHLKVIKLNTEVDAAKLAAQTPGFAGAEIANVCNEAALIAARRNKQSVDMQDFNDAIDRVIGGLEKKNKIISPEEKKVVAYHEAGHAICGWFLEHADPLVKVSIIPRGVAALGYAQYLPKEQYLYSTDQMLDSVCKLLGGRAAEDVIFGSVTTGAQNDLERVTKIAYSMIVLYGMNKEIGLISYNEQNNEYNFQKPYSDETARKIDEEVKKFVDMAYQRTLVLLRSKREQLEAVAKELLEKEVIFKDDLVRLIGERPFDKKSEPVEVVDESTTKASVAENGSATPESSEAKADTPSATETDTTPEETEAPDTASRD